MRAAPERPEDACLKMPVGRCLSEGLCMEGGQKTASSHENLKCGTVKTKDEHRGPALRD